jgi:hypothetical protein
MKLRPMGANVLLESAQEGKYWGRYSFIAFGRPCFSFEQAGSQAWQEVRNFWKGIKALLLPIYPPSREDW